MNDDNDNVVKLADAGAVRTKLRLPRIIMLNGPPSSGKDTAAEAIKMAFNSSTTPVLLDKFSAPLKSIVTNSFGITDEQLDQFKDKPCPGLANKTGRDVQISLSEEWFKPMFGKGVFGELAKRRLWNNWQHAYKNQAGMYSDVYPVWVYSDCGFQEEVDALLDSLGTYDRAMLIRLHRPGCSFENDSRGWVTLTEAHEDIAVEDINNDGTIEAFLDTLLTRVRPWMYEGVLDA